MQLNEKLSILPELQASVQQLVNDRYKNLWGFVVVFAGVIGTYVLGHLGGPWLAK